MVSTEHGWQADFEPLRAPTLEQDLRLRDFTVNAIAEPLAGGEPIDPLGGIEDLREGRLRAASPGAFLEDPLRVMRLARVAVELDLEAEPETLALARAGAPGLREVSAERVFAELRRILSAAQARRGVELLADVGANAVVLPELEQLRGVEQSRYHHADVYVHTLEVLERTVALTHALADGGVPPAAVGAGEQVRARWRDGPAAAPPPGGAVLAEPLADELTRGQALAWGALLHDAAKPLTRGISADGARVTFIGHDVAGAELAREVLGRLRGSERLQPSWRDWCATTCASAFSCTSPSRCRGGRCSAICAPARRSRSTSPLLSIADRLATRGTAPRRRSPHTCSWRSRSSPTRSSGASTGRPRSPLRGDELADELGHHPRPPPRGAARGAARGALRRGHHHPRRGGSVRARAARRAAGPRRP